MNVLDDLTSILRLHFRRGFKTTQNVMSRSSINCYLSTEPSLICFVVLTGTVLESSHFCLDLSPSIALSTIHPYVTKRYWQELTDAHFSSLKYCPAYSIHCNKAESDSVQTLPVPYYCNFLKINNLYYGCYLVLTMNFWSIISPVKKLQPASRRRFVQYMMCIRTYA